MISLLFSSLIFEKIFILPHAITEFKSNLNKDKHELTHDNCQKIKNIIKFL